MAIISISRGSMSFGRALAERLSAALGLPCVGRELIHEAAQKLGVSQGLMASKLDELPTFWDRLTSERKLYMTAMQAALAEHVLTGDFVYHSWAGHLLLRGAPAVLRIRVVASDEARVAVVMKEKALSQAKAEAYVSKVDDERNRWTRFVYGVDWRDPLQYDAVLNLAVLSLDSACEAVSVMARRPEFTLREDQRGWLQDFAMASRVRLALARSPAGTALDVDVRAENGVVTLSGAAQAASMSASIEGRFEDELRAAAMAVAGVRDVRVNVRPIAVAPVD
jgi:cytidylate kinase